MNSVLKKIIEIENKYILYINILINKYKYINFNKSLL